jgi:hypothetical protein
MVAMDTIKEQAPSETGPNQARPGDHREHCLFVGQDDCCRRVQKNNIIYRVKMHILYETRIPANQQHFIYFEREVHHGHTEWCHGVIQSPMFVICTTFCNQVDIVDCYSLWPISSSSPIGSLKPSRQQFSEAAVFSNADLCEDSYE